MGRRRILRSKSECVTEEQKSLIILRGVYYIYQMSNCNRSGEAELARDCLESIFLLKKSSSNSTVTLQADFSPLSEKEEVSPSSSRTLPTFNSDGNFFTPSFILQVDQERYSDCRELYLKLHEKKVQQISEQKAELFIPRPSKNNSFCCLCRTPFEDYLTHIATPKHKLLVLRSDYNKKISELCDLFRDPASNSQAEVPQKRRRGRPAKCVKTKGIRKERVQKILLGGDQGRPVVSQFSINQ